GPRPASRRAFHVCTVFSAVVHGVEGIRNPRCELGWHSEPGHVLTDSKRQPEEGVGHGERAVSARLWALPPWRCALQGVRRWACGPTPGAGTRRQGGTGGAHAVGGKDSREKWLCISYT